MKLKKVLLAALAAGMVLTAGVGGSMAYFSTYAQAQGGKEVSFGYESEIEEDIQDLTKSVTITNNIKSQPVYARVRAYTGSEYELQISGSDWTDGGDGYWYYKNILKAGETSSVLKVTLANIPEDVDIDDSINVMVLYETTPVYYEVDSEGNATATCDWNMILDSGSSSKGGGK